MRRILLALTLAALSLTTVGSYATAEPLFKATYKGAYGSLKIKMTRTLVEAGNGYELRSYAKAFMASIDEVSTFEKQGGALVPSNYLYSRKIFGVKKREELKFDWKALTATYYKNKDKDGTVALSAGTLDPTLYQLQMQMDLANNNTAGKYSFARRDQHKTYQFTPEGSEAITVKGKRYDALRYVRANKDKATRFWLIPALDYVVAKIEHTEDDGDTYEVALVSYERSSKLDSFLVSK